MSLSNKQKVCKASNWKICLTPPCITVLFVILQSFTNMLRMFKKKSQTFREQTGVKKNNTTPYSIKPKYLFPRR